MNSLTNDVKIDIWDVEKHDWHETVYTLPDSMNEVMQSVFEAKKVCIRVTINGKVRYIQTDQQPVPSLTRKGE